MEMLVKVCTRLSCGAVVRMVNCSELKSSVWEGRFGDREL